MYINEKELKKDINTYLKTYANAYADAASLAITDMARCAIENFYRDYTPEFYDRTYDLRDNSYKPYKHNNGKYIYGGVRITSEDMQPYKNPYTDPSEVAYNSWNGYHGVPVRGIYTMSPLEQVRTMMTDKTFLKNLQYIAEKETMKQNYAILNFLNN